MNDTTSITPQRPDNLSQHLVKLLTGQIRDGQYRPGDQLPTESEIGRQHGISRSVVREAFSQLQARGMIERRRGAGTFVTEPPSEGLGLVDPELVNTAQDVLQMIELRICLESESAAMAALSRTPEQMAELQTVNAAFLDALAKGEDNTANDFRFHQLIAESTGNRYFKDFIAHLGKALIPRNRFRRARLSDAARASLLLRLEQEHKDICNAISRQDADGALTAMRMHLINSRLRVKHLLDQETESPLL
jgi:DNA-binding FadR family transcriptional regulator